MIEADRRIQQLTQSVSGARVGDDPEDVHRLRVASRRLDVWLRLGGRHVLRDDLAWLRRACGPLRNLDVLVAMKDLPAPFAAWLADRRAVERPALREVLGDPRVDALLEALPRLPGVPVEDARAGVVRIVGKVLTRGRAVDDRGADPEALHALRRSLRSLRFALEWVGEDVVDLVALQDVFGALNDAVVLQQWAERFPAADAALADAVAARVAATRAAVLGEWRRARPEMSDMSARWNCS